MAIRKIGIIGGGASGLMAAILAAKNGTEVTVFEHKDRVGKKILMTGNGKCNLTNTSDYHGKYYSSDRESLEKIYTSLSNVSSDDTIRFFSELGMYTKEKRDGGVYPMSEQATTVLDVLRGECMHLNINIMTDCDVVNIKTGKSFEVEFVRYVRAESTTDIISSKNKKSAKGNKSKTREIIGEKKEKLYFDRIILATGGKAAAVSGSDGTGYELAKKLGHHIITPLPALVQLRCEGDYFKAVSGVRVQSELELYIDKKCVAKEYGELQLTDYGISGIPVFQFSRIAARALYEKKACKVKINFIPEITKLPDTESLSYKTLEELLGGMVNKKIATLICRTENISPNKTVYETDRAIVQKCFNRLREFWVTVVDTNSFDNAQVCSGGVPLSEVSEYFESVICPGVYITGELLDCDAICGGYNLQWAWTTGIIAGRAVCK